MVYNGLVINTNMYICRRNTIIHNNMNNRRMTILRGLLVFISLTCGYVCGYATAEADSLVRMKASSTKLIYIDGKPADNAELQAHQDSMMRVISRFYYDQFRHFQDPDAPYFLFMSKDAGLSMGIGGCVRMRAYYDWGGAMPVSSFAPYLIPIPANPMNMRHFATTPAGTALFFRVIGNNERLGNYQLYIETNFSGYESRGLKLKKAYAMVRDFTVGYASSTFSDPAAQPVVLDAAGNNNHYSATSVLVRYMPCFKNRWYLGVSVETPQTMIDQKSPNARARAEWLPDFAALAQYEWAPGQHVRLSGILRTLPYRDLENGSNHNVVGWGVHASSVAHLPYKITTYANFSIGRGIGDLGGDMQYGYYDLLTDPSDNSTLYAPRTTGWCAGVQYNFKPNLFLSLAASQMHLSTRRLTAGSEYKRGTFACATVYWNIMPRVAVAAELDYGRRVNVDDAARNAWRTNVMCSFSF